MTQEPSRLRLLLRWGFDQFIYPLWAALFGRDAEDEPGDEAR